MSNPEGGPRKKVIEKEKRKHYRGTKEWQDHWPRPKEDEDIPTYRTIEEFLKTTQEEPYICSKHITPGSDWSNFLDANSSHDDESSSIFKTPEGKAAVEHFANLIKEDIDQQIINDIIAQAEATDRIRIMRIGDDTQFMEWDNDDKVWIIKSVMRGDFDIELRPDWDDS